MYKPLPSLRETRSFCGQTLRAVLDATNEQIGGSPALGGRVWLLPKFYAHCLNNNREAGVLGCEYVAYLTKWPRMYRAASVAGDVRRGDHRIRWVPRKGLPGRITFGNQPFCIQMNSDWPSHLESMSKREWQSSVDAKHREGRTLKDARSLKSLYGSAVGVPLIDARYGARIGCMIVHSPRERTLSDVQRDVILELMYARAPVLAREIVEVVRYDFKYAEAHAASRLEDQIQTSEER